MCENTSTAGGDGAGAGMEEDEMTSQVISHYEVTNRRTGVVKSYKTGLAARRAADKMDNAYGAVCCTTRAIWVAQ